MKLVYLFFLCMGLSSIAKGQNTEIIKVKEGTDIGKTIDFDTRFYYNTFQDGLVYFRNGKIVKARMNYSLIHGEIQFIDGKKDTLNLTEKEFINKITVGVDTFFYNKRYGHVRKVAHFKQVGLVEKPIISSLGTERQAAYGQYSSTSAISSYSTYSPGMGLPQKLEGSDKILLRKKTTLFLMDENRDLDLVTKGSILKAYPKNKKEISEYLKENKFEFNQVEDMVQILTYASSL